MSAARTRTLSARHVRLLRDGVPKGERSEAVRSVIIAMINAEWAWADFLDAFNDTGNKLANYFDLDRRGRSFSRARRDQLLLREWSSAQAWVEANPAVATTSEARQELGLIAAQVRASPLKPNDKHVLLAVLDIGSECGRLDPTISQRQLAERVGLPRTTVRDALARLEEAKRISVEAAAGHRMAPTITILKHPGKHHDRVEDVDVDWAPPPSHIVASNLWCAWGESARAVYRALDQVERRPSIIAARACVHVRTAQRWCSNLAEVGLAVATDAGYRVGTASVEDVARDERVPDVLGQRRMQHALDRGERPGVAA